MAFGKTLSNTIDHLLNLKLKKERNQNQDKEVDSLYQEIEISPKEIEKNKNDSNDSSNPPGHVNTDTEQLSFGQVRVKDNEIYVEGLPGHNILPYINPSEDVDIFINDQPVKSKVAVSEYDNIRVDLQVYEKPFALTIHTSEDGLTAYMSVQLQIEKKYVLVDQPPKQCLDLITTTITKKYCPIGMDEILTRIENEGIKLGIDFPAIQQFLANPQDGKIVIARGVLPTDSRDDVVEVLFPEEVIKHQYSDNEKIDFFNCKSIPSVDADNLLAVRREGEIGQSGLSVFEEVVLPREPKKLIVRAGKGVRVEENMVFADMSGRPMVKRNGSVWLFSVEPYLRHHGDINLSTGNQNFSGNIEVYGDICDGMTVSAGGNIHIIGCVSQAKVIAMESVKVGKCIGSLVQAGGDSHYIGNCYITLKELHTDLKGLFSTVNVLLDNSKLNKYKNQTAQIILTLIEKKFNRIPKLLKETVHFLEITPVDMSSEVKALLEMIKKQIPPRNLTENKLKILIDYVELAKDFFAQLSNVSADVHVDYAFNGVIAATNDVHIAGQGCFNTKITAGGNVFIDGVIRGGEVNAIESIIVKEAGSEIGTRTILKSESGKIKILKKIYDGVIINVGGRRLELTSTMGPVEFRNDGGEHVSIINI